jgi:hypothetical protein
MNELYVEILHSYNFTDMSLKFRVVIIFLNVFLHKIFHHIAQ